eukprot:c43145_g1_i1 orf=479-1306(-)
MTLEGERGKNAVKGSLDAKLRHRSKRKSGVPLRYLKPGALAQLLDAYRNAEAYRCYAEKRRGLRDSRVASEPLLIRSGDVGYPPVQVQLTPGPSVRVFGPLCPQRKKLLAPKASLSPANENPAGRTPNHAVAQTPSESPLESLPLQLLDSCLLIARQCHFNFTTPNCDRQEAVSLSAPMPGEKWPFMHRGEAMGVSLVRHLEPKAPKPAPEPTYAQISLADDVQQLAAPLFQGSTSQMHSVNPPKTPQLAVMAVASHPVLFYEEELSQAVAHNCI